MPSYILIHGGAEGAWCWDPIVPLLRAAKGVQDVVAVDLPGFGERRLTDHDHITFGDSVATVVDHANRLNLRNIILVGHSMGSITAIEASQLISERLDRLILLGGMVPYEGVSSSDMLQIHFDGQPSPMERMNSSSEREIYGADDMDAATEEWFFHRLTPLDAIPKQPLATPIYPSRIPTHVPVTYVIQTRDHSLPVDMQRRMIANLPHPPEEVIELDSGRNPMIGRPQETARLLLRYA